ncbi:MAG: hypothetical protein IPG08_01850 [Sphingobacteriaceae bacterium]|nr:hypothetical protein [Sphingobacteriaceae bacterium]
MAGSNEEFIFIVALFLTSCSYQTIKVNDAQPCKVKLNKKFRINLPEDHRTGYTWQLNDEYDKSYTRPHEYGLGRK